MITDQDVFQCIGRLESHGRQWRCTRRAAKKYDNKLCGYCASLHPRNCREVNLTNISVVKRMHSARCFTGQDDCTLS